VESRPIKENLQVTDRHARNVRIFAPFAVRVKVDGPRVPRMFSANQLTSRRCDFT
jgi:hypothetical protein